MIRLYCRVSTSSQAETGISLEAQEAQGRAWAAIKGYPEVRIYKDEGISGFKGHRPALQEALTESRKGDIFVVYSLSRFSRSVKDCLIMLEELGKKGVKFVSLSENLDETTPTGKAMIGMVAIFAQLFRDQISEATKTALAHKRALGQKTGGKVPYGWDVGKEGKLIRNKKEFGVIQAMKGYIEAGKSLRYICAQFDQHAIPTKTGGQWTASTIRGILKRELR